MPPRELDSQLANEPHPHSSFVVVFQAESDMERLVGYGRTNEMPPMIVEMGVFQLFDPLCRHMTKLGITTLYSRLNMLVKMSFHAGTGHDS